VPPGPGCAYQHWSTTVFEAQHYPDSVHHDNFPSVVVRAGGTYTQHTRYTFTSL
jgi:aldose 1-epimerase